MPSRSLGSKLRWCHVSFFRGPLLDLWSCFQGYHLDFGFGFQEAFNFAFGYCACAYYQARAVFQLQEEGEEFWWRLAGHFGDAWW